VRPCVGGIAPISDRIEAIGDLNTGQSTTKAIKA
jgi:hypothetical protein